MHCYVVIRHLPGSRPVTESVSLSAVELSSDKMEKLCQLAKNEIVSQFPEFKNATWYIDEMTVAIPR